MSAVLFSFLFLRASLFQRAEQFSIVCTKDPVTNCCLEFPSSSEYVVNLIRSMYALNATADRPPIARFDAHNRRASFHRQAMHNQNANNNQNGGQNSPQPSNHSEITTASSNSDSGIGFHNDFTNVSDRIVVVDFASANGANQRKPLPNLPVHPPHKSRPNERPVPFGADSIRNIRSTIDNPSTSQLPAKPHIFHAKSKSLDCTLHDSSRLPGVRARPKAAAAAPVHLIRAMPDPPQKCAATASAAVASNRASLPTSPIKCAQYETIFGTGSDETMSGPAATVQVCEIHTDEDDDDDMGAGRAPKMGDRKFASILTTRSCDDILMSVRDQEALKRRQAQMLASFDDVSLLGEAPPPPLPSRSKQAAKVTDDTDDYVFLAPQALPIGKKSRKKAKKSPGSAEKSNGALLDDFLSASIVYYRNRLTRSIGKENQADNKMAKTGSSKAKRRLSIDPKENLCSIKDRDFSVWGSLQDLEVLSRLDISRNGPSTPTRDLMEPSYSEPDLLVSGFPFLFHRSDCVRLLFVRKFVDRLPLFCGITVSNVQMRRDHDMIYGPDKRNGMLLE